MEAMKELSMIEDLFKKRRQIRVCMGPGSNPSKELIHDLITRAFNIVNKTESFPLKYM